MPKQTLLICAALAVLCAVTYSPSLSLPLLEDDYANIWAAQHYGSLAGFTPMLHDDVARIRATVYWDIYLVWKYYGFSPEAFRTSNVLLHILDTWLVYALGLAWTRMRSAAAWAAVFFAVYEGHQEAIMWFSGNNELLLFLFGGASLWCWIKTSAKPTGAWPLRIAGLLLFVLALLSKESAYIFLPLFLLTMPAENRRRNLAHLAPYCLLAAVAVVSVALTRAHSFRFADGSFSLHAPFWLTLPRNFGRVLWFWGLLSLGLLFLTRSAAVVLKSAFFALAWIAIALVPYSFLTYSAQIPSRQLYLASVGLSFLFGLAIARLGEFASGREWIVALVMIAMIAHNAGYIWIKKQRQFLERAQPTEALIRVAQQTDGPLWVQCFPRHPSIAEAAIWVALERYPSNLVFAKTEADFEKATGRKPAATFCFTEIHR